jgi:hypothetical protein
MLIFSIPIASAANDVWVAKSSGYINSSESVSFENYIIKSRILDNNRASIAIYERQALVETTDFNINDFKTYGTIGITLLGINGEYSWISISKLENKDVWRPFNKTMLKWGDKYTIDNYTFELDNFSTDSVNLTISGKGVVVSRAFLKDEIKDLGSDSLRAVVRDMNRTGFVELEFFTPRVSGIKAEISTEKDEYYPDERINVTINMISADIQNILWVVLESNNPSGIYPGRFSMTQMTGTKSFQSQILQFPPNSTITIRARIETRDYYDKTEVSMVTKDIFITPVVALKKIAPEDTDEENVPVQLYVYNSGTSNKSIHIHDSIPKELGRKEMDWDIELGPKKSTNLTYNIIPQNPGLYLLSPAIANWDGQSTISKKVNMTVHMPRISMTKISEISNNRTEVKVAIINTGDRPAKVEANDKVPDGYLIISGDTKWSGKLEESEKITIRYTLSGEILTLPAANATYLDIQGVIRQVQSNTIEPKKAVLNNNTNESSKPLNAGHELLSFMVLSFIAIAGIIIIVSLTVYLVTRSRSKQ